MPDSEGQIHSDELFARLVEFEGSGSCVIETVGKKRRKAFCKVAHLLDPIRTIQKYYLDPVKGERRIADKLKNPMNQAFIDSMANYLLGQLRERGLSPHFCLFYGGFQAVADTYNYNITTEFESYRRYKAFWERKKEGLFSLKVLNENSDEEEHWICDTPTSVKTIEFSYSTPSSRRSERSHISLQCLDLSGVEGTLVELESMQSLSEQGEAESDEAEADAEEEEDEEEEDLSVYIELPKYPVMLIFQEEMEGVLDDLLEEDHEPDWEDKWTAWTFQIIAALCAAQAVLGFTHNDLHTNNIVWKTTEESWIFYKTRDGVVWKVPTFGKILCIIDFGRSIFRLKDTWYISDDYNRGGDAEGQYNFDSIANSKEPTIYPNPSFDLSRYSVSIIESLYDETPTEILDAPLLSKEGSWEIRETESPLWNLLWSWLIDDNGRNVLQEEDGSERFPDFDLYSHIAAHVHGAKPQEQIFKDIFSKYKIAAGSVGDWETVYPLFC